MPLKEKPSAARHAGEVANGDSSPDAGRIEADSGLIPVSKCGTAKDPEPGRNSLNG
jgi:hypothetical protein